MKEDGKKNIKIKNRIKIKLEIEKKHKQKAITIKMKSETMKKMDTLASLSRDEDNISDSFIN